MVVVDSHVHLLPGRLGEKVRDDFAHLAGHLVDPIDHDVVRRRLAEDGGSARPGEGGRWPGRGS